VARLYLNSRTQPRFSFDLSSAAVLQLTSSKMFSPATLILSLGVVGQAVANPRPHNTTDAKHGAVASESSVCSQIGIDILKVGGNAADSVRKVFITLNVYTKFKSASSNSTMCGSCCHVPFGYWRRRFYDYSLE
jgi:hypothetical protein